MQLNRRKAPLPAAGLFVAQAKIGWYSGRVPTFFANFMSSRDHCRLWRLVALCAASLATSAGLARSANAYYSNGRWTSTATNFSTSAAGFPATLTWSIVPDGTAISTGGTSSLIAFLDGLYGNGGGGALAQRPWFTLIEQSFSRWTDLSGLAFVYEPADDGAMHGSFLGSLGVRGDVRLSGKFLDGIGGTNAQAGFIPNADLTVDTGDGVYFGNVANGSRAMRNTLMHEIGHSFGLGHVDSNSAAFLMEGFSNNSFEGPQLDDIRGVQALYGDKYERLAGGIGNDSAANASPLGLIAAGTELAIGAHAATGTLVLAGETDFASVANQNDVDFFSFTVAGPSLIDLTLTPVGASYNERIGGSTGAFATTNAAQASNLSLELFAMVGETLTSLGLADGQPIGVAETLANIELAEGGEYFVKIAGSGSVVQLYQLAINVEAMTVEPGVPGDFNEDGSVDGADFLAWQFGFGNSYHAEDLAVWQSHFGAVGFPQLSQSAVGAPTPEPSGVALGLACPISTLGIAHAKRRGRGGSEAVPRDVACV